MSIPIRSIRASRISRSGWVLVVVGALGCRSNPLPPDTRPRWSVSTAPRFSIGDAEEKPGHELAGVSGARIQGGNVIIANMSSFELRVFDTSGALIKTVGRKGEGPGEFRGAMFLFPAPGDSLYVFDGGNLRYAMHDRAGNFVRVLPRGTEAVTRPTWLYRRTVVESNTPGQSPAWALAVLDRLPDAAPHDPVRRAKFDDLGYLWVTDSGTTRDWTVYADSTLPIGALSFPGGFEFLQAGADFVLGLERDSVGRELVRAYALTRGNRLQPRPATPDVPPTVRDSAAESEAARPMMMTLRNLMTAQEAQYSEHSSYTANADSLMVEAVSGVEVVIMAADARHWHGILYHRKSRTTCGTSVGFPAPPGWVDGLVFCGR